MQAIKEKIQDMKDARKAKAELKAEEKAEKELAKARVDMAHEARLAKEAEAEMDRHVARAGEIAEKEIAKHHSNKSNAMDMSGIDVAPVEAARSFHSPTTDACGSGGFVSMEAAGAGRSAPMDAGSAERCAAMEAGSAIERRTYPTN